MEKNVQKENAKWKVKNHQRNEQIDDKLGEKLNASNQDEFLK